MIRAEMYQLDRKSNCWTLLNHIMGEDYEKKLYGKLAIIEQEIKKRKEKEEKEKQEIEELVKTKETSISLSNQIQTTQQKEEQQVQHFRRKR